MGTLRKAGVWLGLVEEDDDQHDDGFFDDVLVEDEEYAARPRTRPMVRPRGAEQDRDPREHDPQLRRRLRDRDPAAAQPQGWRSDRSYHPADADQRGTEVYRSETHRTDTHRPDLDPGEPTGTRRGSVRPLVRPGSVNAFNHPTQDNLALAPQVQLSERAVVGDEPGRRYHITTLHPTTYSEARAIGERFRDGVPVIMNLTDMAEADAKRLVDFAAGLIFGLRGSMERVTNRVFLLSPRDIQVSAEEKARIAQDGLPDRG